jgi:hypothetical protein
MAVVGLAGRGKQRDRGGAVRAVEDGVKCSIARAVRGLTALLMVAGCAAAADGAGVRPLLPMEAPPGPAPWQGAAADAANRSQAAPSTPALRALQGKVPLAHIRQGPWSEDRPYEAAFELAIFDDGTLVYEGHRCVKVGGVVLRRLDGEEIGQVRELLARSCVAFDSASDDEICGEDGGLRVSCSNGEQMFRGTDRCRRGGEQSGALRGLAAALLDRVGVAAWLGGPTQRQACQPGASDLAPRELSRALATTAL